MLPLRVLAADAQPITIEASGSLVWHQSDKTYHAIGDASATRGTLTVHADELTAHYTEVKGQNEIQSLDAKGHVTIVQEGNTAVGPLANYDMNSGDMVMTGTGLKLTGANGDTLTAEQQITFNDKTGVAHALGAPVVTRQDRNIRARQLDAQFMKDADNNWVLQTATATSDVIVTAKDSIATGNHGFYDATKNTALLTGDVKIAKGQNTMTGDRAEINTTTGEARLLPAETAPGAPKGRVKAILYQSK